MDDCKNCSMPVGISCCFNCGRADSECGVWHTCGKNCPGWERRIENNLISREALLEIMPKDDVLMSFDVRRIIWDSPIVDAEPVRHGRWEHLGGDEWCCTICGEVIHTEGTEKPEDKYCRECGARMDGEAKKQWK